MPDEYIAQFAGTDDGSTAAAKRYIAEAASFRAQTLTASSSTDSVALAKWLHSGMALARMYCGAYFEQLSKQESQLTYAKAQTNVVGGLTAATLGIFSAPASTISTVAASFSAIGASLDTYDNNILLGPHVDKFEKLVEKAQDAIFQSSLNATYNDFGTAQNVLVNYVNLCSFRGVKSLVEDAVTSAEVITPGGSTTGKVMVVSAQELKNQNDILRREVQGLNVRLLHMTSPAAQPASAPAAAPTK